MLVLEDGLRKRIQFTYTVFSYDNIICRDVLCYPFSIGSTRMKRLQRLARQQRCYPERHGNVGGVPWNLMSQEMRDRVIEFFRTPTHWCLDFKYLLLPWEELTMPTHTYLLLRVL